MLLYESVYICKMYVSYETNQHTYIHTYIYIHPPCPTVGHKYAMGVNHSITVAHHSICVASVEVDTVYRNIFAGSQALGH